MEINSLVILFLALFECVRCTNDSYGSAESRVLSRRKRFLLFPEGSSFQLVFCVQTSALIPIGDIFLYGQTAALAWNLPTDPAMFHMFKGEKVAQRRGDQDQKNIYYLDEQGKVIAKVPYKRPTIVNPVFAKRSVDNKMTYKEKLKQLKIDRRQMHETRLAEDFLKKKNLDRKYLEFHRSSRLGLFEKLETFFSALGQNGRQCVLHKLCKAGQRYSQQGTFLQEMLRAIFTLPRRSEDEEYDEAHAATDDCDQRYSCQDLTGSEEL